MQPIVPHRSLDCRSGLHCTSVAGDPDRREGVTTQQVGDSAGTVNSRLGNYRYLHHLLPGFVISQPECESYYSP